MKILMTVLLFLMMAFDFSFAQTSFNISNQTTGDTLFTIDNQGNTGIGLTNPWARLDVLMFGTGAWQRGFRVLNPDMIADDGLLFVLGRSDDFRNMGYLNFKYSADQSESNRLSFGLYGVNDVLNVMGSGNVGIGTTTPAEKLTFTYDNFIGWEYSESNSSVSHKIGKSSNGAGPLEFITTFNPGATGQTFSFRNPVDRMTILYNGNVGIGTTTPQTKLDVADTIRSSFGGFQFPDGTVQETAAGSGSGNGNTLDQAYDQGGAGLGRTITADAGAFQISGTDGVLFTGTPGSGSIPFTGAGSRMMWYPNKASFRTGSILNAPPIPVTQWDDENIGENSFATGVNTTASGYASFATGSLSAATGDWSTAMGQATLASGDRATAFGDGTSATGSYSLATGLGTTASGHYSTAMGYHSNASNYYSTALGNGTTASGGTSTALGYETIASGNISTAMGFGIETAGDYSFAIALNNQIGTRLDQNETMAIMGGKVGINELAPSADFQVVGIDGILFSGTFGSGTIPEEGAGTRMMWYPAKAAFRAGGVSESGSSFWDDDSIGPYSFAAGEAAVASGWRSAALGSYTHAIGNASTALGANTFARGGNSLAIGFLSATGSSASNSCAIGYASSTLGENSFATGYSVSAQGDHSVATGSETIAEGVYSVAMGSNSTASGLASIVLGTSNESSGDYAIAFGYQNSATANSTTAFGYNSIASNSFATAIGLNTEAGGYASIALGRNTVASATSSTAMGYLTTADGLYSTSMGRSTTASGNYSTAMGSYVSTSGSGSLIIGDQSTTTVLSRSQDNRFSARFADGYRFYTNSSSSVGAALTAGASSWSVISDSTKKENFKIVNGEEFLNKIGNFNLTSWNYKGQDPNQFRHYGPMAQDFYAAFGNDGIGTIGNDTTIASADFDGINFIAIQALEKRTADLQKENEILRQENTQLKSQMNALAKMVYEMKITMANLQQQNINKTQNITLVKSN